MTMVVIVIMVVMLSVMVMVMIMIMIMNGYSNVSNWATNELHYTDKSISLTQIPQQT